MTITACLLLLMAYINKGNPTNKVSFPIKYKDSSVVMEMAFTNNNSSLPKFEFSLDLTVNYSFIIDSNIESIKPVIVVTEESKNLVDNYFGYVTFANLTSNSLSLVG